MPSFLQARKIANVSDINAHPVYGDHVGFGIRVSEYIDNLPFPFHPKWGDHIIFRIYFRLVMVLAVTVLATESVTHPSTGHTIMMFIGAVHMHIWWYILAGHMLVSLLWKMIMSGMAWLRFSIKSDLSEYVLLFKKFYLNVINHSILWKLVRRLWHIVLSFTGEVGGGGGEGWVWYVCAAPWAICSIILWGIITLCCI